MAHHFGKSEKLKRKAHIDALFSEGKSLKRFPVKLVYRPITLSTTHKVGVSVPKHNFKHAVDRNRLKRLLRESYRLNKNLIAETPRHYALMLIYMGRQNAEFDRVFSAVQNLLTEFAKKTKS